MCQCDNSKIAMNVDPYFHRTPLDVSNACHNDFSKRLKDADIFFDVFYCGNHVGLVTSTTMFAFKAKVERTHNNTLSLHIYAKDCQRVLFLGYKIFDQNLHELFRAEIFRR